MTKLGASILKKIQKEKIIPIPRWHFVLLHVLLWSAVIVAIALGSLAVSVIISIIFGTEWEIVRVVGKGALHSFLLVLPYVWIALLALIIFLASKLFEKTKTGHRHKHILVAIGSVVISLVIGAVLYFAGVGHSVHEGLEKIGPYADWSEMREKAMVAPDEGVLVGKVVFIKSDEEIMIIDFLKTKWTVDTSDAEFKNGFEPIVGMPIGTLGEKIEDGLFKAEKVMPLRRPRNGMHKMVKGGVPMPLDAPISIPEE